MQEREKLALTAKQIRLQIASNIGDDHGVHMLFVLVCCILAKVDLCHFSVLTYLINIPGLEIAIDKFIAWKRK